MGRSRRTLPAGLVAVGLFLSACGGDDSIAGTYRCKAPGEPDEFAQVTELAGDGTATIKPVAGPLEEGTWSVEGETVMFEFPGTDADGEATIEGDRLVFGDGAFVCTPES